MCAAQYQYLASAESICAMRDAHAVIGPDNHLPSAFPYQDKAFAPSGEGYGAVAAVQTGRLLTSRRVTYAQTHIVQPVQHYRSHYLVQ